jgi:hypothetical protein
MKGRGGGERERERAPLSARNEILRPAASHTHANTHTHTHTHTYYYRETQHLRAPGVDLPGRQARGRKHSGQELRLPRRGQEGEHLRDCIFSVSVSLSLSLSVSLFLCVRWAR